MSGRAEVTQGLRVVRDWVSLGCLAVLLTQGCGLVGGEAKPDWVTGTSRGYPAEQYITGVGEAASLTSATERAYAAVAKVFSARVTSEAKDWESYVLVERRGTNRDERRLALDQVITVTTDKVLENVSVLDQWYDQSARQHVVLAGIARGPAEQATLAKLHDLDDSIEQHVREARATSEPLLQVRWLKRAVTSLLLREAYHSDLRVIARNGQGLPARYRLAELTTELEQHVASMPIEVDLRGDDHEAMARALSEGLVREGLAVVGASFKGVTDSSASSAPSGDLRLSGLVRIWPIEVQDPRFHYVRWCSDVLLLEPKTERVVGAFSRGDKVGHISVPEAMGKARRMIEQDFVSEVAKQVAAYVYGEVEAMTDPVPGACPRDRELPAPLMH